MLPRTDQHETFMRQALQEARAALASGEFPVGCVLAHKDRILARGHRRGTADTHNEGRLFSETDHAEIITLQRYYRASPAVADPCELTLYSTMEPCLMCWGAILLSGIGAVVYAYEDAMGGATALDRTQLAPLYRQRQISVIAPVLRAESLALFKRYFQNDTHRYWRDSYLARYTLGQ